MSGGRLRLGVLLVALSVMMNRAYAAAAPPGSQPSDGPPQLRTMLAVITAGGGAENFQTTTLFEVLAGSLAGDEATRITKRFGAADVKGIVATLDFLIADIVRAGNARAIVFPAVPAPDPKDGRALTSALYALGTDKATGQFTVERMLDHLVSYRLRVAMLRDAEAKYGASSVARFRSAVQMTMSDLKKSYSL